MKKYYTVKRISSNAVMVISDTKAGAAKKLQARLKLKNEGLKEDDPEYLTPFDFFIEEEEGNCPNVTISNYDAALSVLDIQHRQLETLLVNPHHAKAVLALNELLTIAEAWNKADDFVPDFSDREQKKWFPWFIYSPDAAGFVCANTHSAASFADAASGSRLCFKTEERACQFGEQFIDLWNDFLLIR